ncbi:MAG: alginate export family protein [Gammaproteobacteria bacterium]|nr:alginate export family protein [Gammaproteobacteria bacterium]
MRAYTKTLLIGLLSSFTFSGHCLSGSLFTLENALQLPDRFTLQGTHRTRYETLSHQFRNTLEGSDQILVQKTTLFASVKLEPFAVTVEIGDSRAYLDDNGTSISTTHVNPLELIQGYISAKQKNFFKNGDQSTLNVGRLTLDMGSGRLVARTKFRNTVNSFTGVEWKWKKNTGDQLHFFYTMPINRSPDSIRELRKNSIKFDKETGATTFWGVNYSSDRLPLGHKGEIYILGLDEDDTENNSTLNREIITSGFRLSFPQKTGAIDYLIESIFQVGEVRSSKANEKNLDHFAHFQHIEIGYTGKSKKKIRSALEYDYASGDNSSLDKKNGRFDSLYGARRFEYGPVGIFGAFNRSNISSPGIRVSMLPNNRSQLMIGYRGFWRANKGDSWVAAKISDPTGTASSFLGQQIEARLRWELAPNNSLIEIGTAYLRSGKYARDAGNKAYKKDIFYNYLQLSFSF